MAVMFMENKTCILLVEDEFLIAIAEARVLEMNGYKVMIVDNGFEAIKTLESSSDINLILMDIDLGKGMDGTQTAEIILKNYDIPIVFLSSHSDPEIVNKTESITSYGYIVKNSGETVLLASIKMALKLFASKKAHLKTIFSLEQAQRLTGIGTWEWNLQTGQIKWSDEIYSIYNVDKNTYIPSMESFSNFIHPDDREKINDIITKILNNK